MKLELSLWAEGEYVNPPTLRTLVRRWERGELPVDLIKEGKTYYVSLNNWADEVVRNAAQA